MKKAQQCKIKPRYFCFRVQVCLSPGGRMGKSCRIRVSQERMQCLNEAEHGWVVRMYIPFVLRESKCKKAL